MAAASAMPFRLSVCGIDELETECTADPTHIVSILDPETAEPQAVSRFPDGARARLRFHDVNHETEGYAAPQREHIETLFAFGRAMAACPSPHLLVHCHAGISRSTAAAVALLVQRYPGAEREAFEWVSGVRPVAWPNARMIALADAVLGLDGALNAALAWYRREIPAAWGAAFGPAD
jgi:predicted protein tyrosine phosphatase